MFAVATAVDPIPVAIDETFIGTGGCETCTEVVLPTYPLPPLTTVILDIVPTPETVAVNAADTGLLSFTTNPDTSIEFT